MNKTQILEIQKQIGVEPDGFWGPHSIRACKQYLRSLMPNPHPFPLPDAASLRAFYGNPGSESLHTTILVSASCEIRYEGKRILRIRCHSRLAPSLSRIITRLAASDPEILLQFDGCYANRPMRNGSATSLHAYAAAVDFCADTNGNTTHWPTAADMPLTVMSIFACEGWLPAGAFWGRDAMHFQATR